MWLEVCLRLAWLSYIDNLAWVLFTCGLGLVYFWDGVHLAKALLTFGSVALHLAWGILQFWLGYCLRLGWLM